MWRVRSVTVIIATVVALGVATPAPAAHAQSRPAAVAGPAVPRPAAKVKPPRPAVTAVTPAEGPTPGGTVVTVLGTDLGAASKVDFGGVAATAVTVVSPNELRVTAPPRKSAGRVHVRVTAPAGRSLTSDADAFTYLPAPAVESVSIVAGPLAGGTEVTVRGARFTPASVVSFGNRPALSARFVSDTELVAVSPAASTAGRVQVRVAVAAGWRPGTSHATFRYVAPPVLRRVSPRTGPLTGGTLVTLTGSGLGAADQVLVGELPAQVVTATNSKVTFRAPAAGGPGTVPVRVRTPGGLSAPGDGLDYTYLGTAPTVTAVAPSSGPAAGGQRVVISGNELAGVTAVRFGETETTHVTLRSATELEVVSPPDDGGRTVDVRVVGPGGVSAPGAAARYTYDAAPAVPGVPTGLVATAGNGRAWLAWAPGAGDVAGYRVYRAAAAAGPWALVSTSPLTQPAFTAPGLANGVEAWFAVSAVGPTGLESNRTAPVAVTATDRITHCGALTADETWSPEFLHVIACTVTVPAGRTLTLPAGAVVQAHARLEVRGHLVGAGTAEAPVEIASGDERAPGSWPGILVAPLADQASEAGVDLQHVRVLDATIGLQAQSAHVSIDRSSFGSAACSGVIVLEAKGVPAVTNSRFTASGSSACAFYPLVVSGNELDLARLTGDFGSGNYVDGTALTGVVRHSSTWPAPVDGWVTGVAGYAVDSPMGGLDIAAGTRVDVPAGGVVKLLRSSLQVSGELVVAGTAEAPATITSWRDDTTVGDSNRGEPDTRPAVGDWGAISASDGAALTVRHARIAYASAAQDTPGSGAVDARRARAVSVTDSTITDTTRTGVSVHGTATPPEVARNRVERTGQASTDANDWAVMVNGDLDPDLLDGNSGIGNRHSGTLVSGTVAQPGTFTATAPGWVVGIGGGYWLGGYGDPWVAYPELIVPSGVGLGFDGAVVKAQSERALRSSGTLTVRGTDAAPSVLTSVTDDTVGGDTDHGDVERSGGDAMPPVWAGVVAAAVDAEHWQLRHARRALVATGPSVRVVDSAVSDNTEGLDVTADHVEIRRSAFVRQAGAGVRVTSPHLDLALLTGNHGAGNGTNATVVRGTLTGDATLPAAEPGWPFAVGASSTGPALVVPAGATLTLPAGSVLKSAGTIDVRGGLVGEGADAAPVTVTSWADDTVGGDTDGNGATTGHPGDWPGVLVHPDAAAGGSSRLVLRHTRVAYAVNDVATDNADVDVDASRFEGGQCAGLLVTAAPASPRVHGSRFEGNGSDGCRFHALSVQSDHLDPGLISANTGAGNYVDGTALHGDVVTSTWPAVEGGWVTGIGSHAYGSPAQLRVPPGQTLTVPAGGVVKMLGAGLLVDGTLALQGTAGAPAVLTSWRDDTALGDGDPGEGAAAEPAAGDWAGVYVKPGGALDARHARLAYGGVLPDQPGSGTIFADDARAVAVRDSTVSHTTRAGISVHGTATAPVISGNLVEHTGAATHDANDWAVVVHGDHLRPSDLGGNHGPGNRHPGLLVSGSIEASIDVDGGRFARTAPGWAIGIGGGHRYGGYADPWHEYESLDIPEHTHASVAAGSVVKFMPGRRIFVGDRLDLEGGPDDDPVVLTSWKDDTAAGETDAGDADAPGEDETPRPLTWGFTVRFGAFVDGPHAMFRYGGRLQVQGVPESVTGNTYDDDGSAVRTWLDSHCVDEQGDGTTKDEACVQHFYACLKATREALVSNTGLPLPTPPQTAEDWWLMTAQVLADTFGRNVSALSPSVSYFSAMWTVVPAFATAFQTCSAPT